MNPVHFGHPGLFGTGAKRIVTDTGHTARNRNIGQAITIKKRMAANADHSIGNGYFCQVAAFTKGITANGGDSTHNHNFLNIGTIAVPRGVGIQIIRHVAAAGDGKNAVIGEFPGQVITAGAGIENSGHGSVEGIEIVKQWQQNSLRVGNQGFLVNSEGIVGIQGRLQPIINRLLFLRSHGPECLHGGKLRDQRGHGIGSSLVHCCLLAFGALVGAGRLRDFCRIAAGIIMDMMAIGDHNHAAAFHRANMPAGNFRRGLRIAAALHVDEDAVFIRQAAAVLARHRRNVAAVPMDMGALGDGLIAARVTHMGAGASRRTGEIAAFRCMLRVVRAQPVHFRGVGRNRDITQHQHAGQHPAKHPFEHLISHLAASRFQKIFLSIIGLVIFVSHSTPKNCNLKRSSLPQCVLGWSVVDTLLGTARFVFARRDWIIRHFPCAETLPRAAQESRISHQPGAPLAAGPARQITIYRCAV